MHELMKYTTLSLASDFFTKVLNAIGQTKVPIGMLTDLVRCVLYHIL
jgi:hypothetical protein